MRRLLLSFTVLVGISGAASAQSAATLFNQCTEFERDARFEPGSIRLPKNSEGLQCLAYFSAVKDLTLVVEDNGTPSLGACAREGISIQQLIMVFLSRARSQPQDLNQPRGQFMLRALVAAFPCRPR